MCMHQLKYVRLNRKDHSKYMRGMTPEVAMLADVECYSAILSVYQCVTEPLSPPLDVLDLYLMNITHIH